MKFYSYGIVLERLREDKIEMVRRWRNDEHIRRFMDYQQEITPEMQRRWFDSINDLNNFFFIISYNVKDIGLIHCSDIDWDKKKGHAGLFIWNVHFIDTYIPVLASLSLLDLFFFGFRLKNIEAKVKNDNRRAIAYNRSLGFEYVEPVNAQFDLYNVSRQSYINTAKRLKKAASGLVPQKPCLQFEPERHSIDKEIEEMLFKLDNKQEWLQEITP